MVRTGKSVFIRYFLRFGSKVNFSGYASGHFEFGSLAENASIFLEGPGGLYLF